MYMLGPVDQCDPLVKLYAYLSVSSEVGWRPHQRGSTESALAWALVPEAVGVERVMPRSTCVANARVMVTPR